MKKLLNLIFILALITSTFAADQWFNYSYPFPVREAVPYGDGFFMATAGGVRFKTATNDAMYMTSKGLGDQSVSAVAFSDLGFFALSDNGVVARMSERDSFEVLNRSYAGNNLRVIPGMMRVAGTAMVIAFEDRLSFFSIPSNRSIVTVDRISDANLSKTPVSAMEVHGDSLFVAVDGVVYVRKMDWYNLEADAHLYDPDSWKVMKNVSSAGEEVKTIVWKDGKIRTYPLEGMWIWEDEKETRVVNDTFLTFADTSSMILVRGKLLKDSILYEKDSVMRSGKGGAVPVVDHYYYKNRVQWVKLLSKGALLAGPEKVFHYDGKKIEDLTTYKPFAVGNVYELQAIPKGGVIAASEAGYFSHNRDLQSWTPPTLAFPIDEKSGLGNMTNARGHDMKVMSVLPDGHVFYHVWGMGFSIFANWGDSATAVIMGSTDNCLDDYTEKDAFVYTIAVASTPAPDNSGFLTATASNKGYSLVYISLDGEVSCANNIGSTSIAGPMIARINEDGKWVVYVGTRSTMGTEANGGLDVITMLPPKKMGGDISKVAKKDVKSYYGAPSTPLDMVYEPKTGYFWMVTAASLVYWSEQDTSLLTPLSTNGLTSANFTSIDVDSRGNLWVGTSMQGAYRLTPRTTNPDTLSVQHFTARQGLLSDRVQDVAVDSVLGVVWFAHDNGVSAYLRKDVGGTDGNMDDDSNKDFKVYPNPFRPRENHSRIVFDNVAEDAVISIFNRGGKLVMALSGDRLVGGRAEWDGTMNNGKLVAPGVYQYVVRTKSKVKKGKLLIVH